MRPLRLDASRGRAVSLLSGRPCQPAAPSRMSRDRVVSMAESPDEFTTMAEVAAILKLNQQTVRNWIFSTVLGVCPATAGP